MRKMMLYGKKYGGTDPQLIEGDTFKMIISIPEFGTDEAITQGNREESGLVDSQKSILKLIAKNPKITVKEIAKKIGISTTAVDKNIKFLKEKKLLNRVGSAKAGHWKIHE